jgi:hypothetical protein
MPEPLLKGTPEMADWPSKTPSAVTGLAASFDAGTIDAIARRFPAAAENVRVGAVGRRIVGGGKRGVAGVVTSGGWMAKTGADPYAKALISVVLCADSYWKRKLMKRQSSETRWKCQSLSLVS